MQTCFICSSAADTEEHIIPKWLQNKYNLWNQSITLPNQTRIFYRQLKIPCCSNCNNNILSPIETRIESGIATAEEIWRWGAKIHFGLLHKDDFLEWDRKNPGYKIGQVIRRDDPIEIDRHLIHSIHGDFTTYPSPFGSVYAFLFEKESEYNFIHLNNPPGLCISLGYIGYVIFISDTGSLKRQSSIEEMYEKHLEKTHAGKMLNFFANSWLHLFRHKVSYPLVMSEKSIAILGEGKLTQEIPFSEQLFTELWQYINSNTNAVTVSNDEYESSNGMV